MTDEPKNPPESSDTSPSEGDETRRAADTSLTADEEKAPGSPAAADARAGELPPPPDAGRPRPTPESQAALTGKAPSGSSSSGTTVPADSGAAAATPPKPKPAAPPANETPEEKKARLERIIAEAKAKKEAREAAAAQGEGGEPAKPSAAPAAQGGEATPPGGKSPEVGDPLKSPSQADLERAAKIAEAKAKAAALKEAAAAKAADASGAGAAAPKTPAAPGAAKPAAPAAAGAAGVPKPPVKKKDEGPKPEDASDNPLVKRLRERFGETVTGAFTFVGQLSIHVKAESVVEICKALRDDAETPFDFLSDLTCVHWPEREEAPFEVVYNLYSISKNERVRVKANADDEGIESVTSIWPSANWMEREAYDLFGVNFKNHPDLRRLLLPKDWDGHPLRKDYPLEFMENQWTARHLPEFTEVQREQLAQRRAYGLEILQTPDERRIRELFRDGRDPLPKEHK
ncbi:MAG TPA: NADH-quinone oxidoreductase subunit C [Pyrinomonadaceae bacterium]|nr:NADH-quinone oxidoreductase subunit C [Pyrinomonadaceae bacterium]